MRKCIDRIIAVLFLIIALILLLATDWKSTWYLTVFSSLEVIIHIWMSVRPKHIKKNNYKDGVKNTLRSPAALTELVLLSEEGTHIASWNIYGKNGLVIGRDVGENNVSVNLNDVTYASMIDIEHAVLNYSGDSWYIEDISERNGISIQKRDGKKYRLSYGKPCKLERGDIIFIALTRLQIL